MASRPIDLTGFAVVFLPALHSFLRRSVQLLAQRARHARREKDKLTPRHPNVRSLSIVHLANANFRFSSYYMLYIVVEKYGANAEERIFLEFLSYSRIQIIREEQRQSVEAPMANKDFF